MRKKMESCQIVCLDYTGWHAGGSDDDKEGCVWGEGTLVQRRRHATSTLERKKRDL